MKVVTRRRIELNVNGEMWEIDIDPSRTLLEVLREDLSLTGAKEGCGLGACGACTVLIDGSPTLSCLKLAIETENKTITTIEGLAKGGHPDPLQVVFIEHGAIQCGFCTPGAIMSAKALFGRTQRPSTEEIKEALAGNLCRCTGYKKIIEAIDSLAQR